MTVCVKQLNGRLPVAEVVLCRALISVVLTGVELRLEGVNPWGQRRGLLLARGFFGSVALLCFFQAIASLPLAVATVLQYTYPTFTALAAAVLLKERVQRGIVAAVLVGWVGITLITQPDWLTNGIDSLPILAVKQMI